MYPTLNQSTSNCFMRHQVTWLMMKFHNCNYSNEGLFYLLPDILSDRQGQFGHKINISRDSWEKCLLWLHTTNDFSRNYFDGLFKMAFFQPSYVNKMAWKRAMHFPICIVRWTLCYINIKCLLKKIFWLFDVLIYFHLHKREDEIEMTNLCVLLSCLANHPSQFG